MDQTNAKILRVLGRMRRWGVHLSGVTDLKSAYAALIGAENALLTEMERELRDLLKSSIAEGGDPFGDPALVGPSTAC